MEKCILCNGEAEFVFQKKILNKYNVNYYQCHTCGALYTEKPYWLNEAYSSAIANIDTGIMQRNLEDRWAVGSLIKLFYNIHGNFLDYGGGYGIFVRLMRDLGFDFYWFDKFAEPLVCKGFEYDNQEIDLITAFELFEHFDNPHEQIEEIMTISKEVFFSTVCYSDAFELPDENWWYYSLDSGQHIIFYSRETLKYIAKKYKLNYYQINNIHWFTSRKVNPVLIKVLAFYLRKCKKFDYEYAVQDMENLLKNK